MEEGRFDYYILLLSFMYVCGIENGTGGDA